MIDPNAYALMFKRNKDMHFAATRDDKQLLAYNEGIYVPYGETVIHEKIMEITTGEGVTTHRMNEIVNLVKWDNYVNRDDFDNNPNIINMANGLYHIEAGISPHTPKHKSLHKSPIAYDPDATCPNIDRFISEVVAEDDVDTIYEICGYALKARKNLKRAFIFVGEKNSGKSVMIKLLKHLVGTKATTNVSPQTVSNTTFGAAQYNDKMLNLIDDLGNTAIKDTGILKSVIAGGSIEGQFKRGHPFDFTPNVLCVFATNEVPKIEPFDEAFASRFSIVAFPNLFEGEFADPELIDKLTTPRELSGLFNKCMEALCRLNERKSFNNDTTIADRVETYKYQANPVERFIDEMCCLDDPDEYVMKDTLFRSYTAWSEDNNFRTELMKELTIALQQRGCVVRRVMTDDDERKRAYIGVGFKTQLSDFM